MHVGRLKAQEDIITIQLREHGRAKGKVRYKTQAQFMGSLQRKRFRLAILNCRGMRVPKRTPAKPWPKQLPQHWDRCRLRQEGLKLRAKRPRLHCLQVQRWERKRRDSPDQAAPKTSNRPFGCRSGKPSDQKSSNNVWENKRKTRSSVLRESQNKRRYIHM